MLSELGEAARKLSFAAVFAGAVGGCYAEGFSNVPTGRDGRPKPPVRVQRATYLLIVAGGLPGVAWGFVRASSGKQKTPWE